MQNHYELLGVPVQATQDQIKSSYRRLALRYHPDKTGGDARYDEQFKRITAAYNVLSDPEKRRQYDHRLFYRPPVSQSHSSQSPPQPAPPRPPRKPSRAQKAQVKADQKRTYLFFAGILLFLILTGTGVYIGMNIYSSGKYYEEGLALEKKKQYEEAIEKYIQVLNVDPEHPGAYEKLADIKISLFNDHYGAVYLYSKAMESRDCPAIVWYKQGKCYFHLQKYENALKVFTRFVKSEPAHDTAWFYLGEISSFKGDFSSAIVNYENAVRNNPAYDVAQYGLALGHYKSDHYLEADTLLTSLIEKDSDNGLYYLLRGRCRQALKLKEKACADFLKADLFGYPKGRDLAVESCDKD
jgi:curved DNA-binding protein CbpA